jgi:hypothetical protein
MCNLSEGPLTTIILNFNLNSPDFLYSSRFIIFIFILYSSRFISPFSHTHTPTHTHARTLTHTHARTLTHTQTHTHVQVQVLH